MSSPIRDLFAGLLPPRRALTELLTPRRTFDDVVLPPATYRQLDDALAQIRHHDLIFQQWGLGDRHDTGLGLAFNFAGPPGTGKTICAEAIAHALGKRLLVVRYAEMESMWVGETGKNVAAVFRLAAEHDAVLFFDEADAIASRRSTTLQQGVQREMNTVVNVLLRELDLFGGVVIFATNLAVNFDPAFERRIRTHILFELPGAAERERIWQVQLHPEKTPIAADVDFRALAERFEVSGGDIKNAVLKAAQMAASAGGTAPAIEQRHFETGMGEVLSAKRVMEQSLFGTDGEASLRELAGLSGAPGAAGGGLVARQDSVEEEIEAFGARLVELEDGVEAWRSRDAADRAALQAALAELRTALDTTADRIRADAAEAVRLQQVVNRMAFAVAAGALIVALVVAALVMLT